MSSSWAASGITFDQTGNTGKDGTTGTSSAGGGGGGGGQGGDLRAGVVEVDDCVSEGPPQICHLPGYGTV